MFDEIINKIESVINTVLAYDPEILSRLAPLSGKVVLVEIDGLDTTLIIKPTDSGLHLSLNEDVTADVSIKGKPLSLLSLLNNQDDKTHFPSDLELKGDINLAQRLQSVMKDLDIDWEELISSYVGDTAARKISLFCRDTKSAITGFINSFKRSSSDYVRFEKEWLPDQLLVNQFIDEIDELRNDVERLKLRVERLNDISNK